MDDNIPPLLCMKDMLENYLDISIQNCIITHNDRIQEFTLEYYFLVYRWSVKDMTYILYTEKELRKIHKIFGHPSIESTKKVLKRASGSKLDSKTKTLIHDIAKDCRICKFAPSRPRSFKLTVGTDDLKFNHNVQVDTMFINGRPVIHIVDQATHFSSAAFLKNQSSKEVWKAIQHLWNLVYLGPPDCIKVDQ